jgi:hypothetical protein
VKELLLELLPSWLVGDRRDQLLYVLALGLLATGTLLCMAALRIRVLDVLAVAVACAGAVAWLLSNTPGEGGTLVVVQPGNGLTFADLAALPAGVLVGYLAVRRLRAG